MTDIQNERMMLAVWANIVQQPAGVSAGMFTSRPLAGIARLFERGHWYPSKEMLEAQQSTQEDYLQAVESYHGNDHSGNVRRQFLKNHARRELFETTRRTLHRLQDMGDTLDGLVSVDDATGIYHGSELEAKVMADIPPADHAIGFGMMDYQLRMTMAGDVITVAGRSGTGKTAIGLQLMQGAWERSGIKSLFFSLEMSYGAIANRLHDIAYYRDHDTSEWESLRERCYAHWCEVKREQSYGDLCPEWLYEDASALHIDRMEDRINAAKGIDQSIGIVCIDYLQLVRANAKDRRNEVSEVARRLKAIAKACGVIVISLCQTSREGKDGSEKVSLHHLKESGDIEEASDVVIGVWHSKSSNAVNYQDIKNRRAGTHPEARLHKCGVYYRDWKPTDTEQITSSYTPEFNF